MSLNRIKYLILVSNVLFGFGLFAPCMTVRPQFGEFTPVIKLLKPDYSLPEQISIAGGTLSLFQEGNFFIGALILVFSVFFPLWKLGVFLNTVSALKQGKPVTGAMHLIEKLGKFSMIDIFVIAVVVLAIKGLPGGSSVEVNWGVFMFTISALINMRIPYLLVALGRA